MIYPPNYLLKMETESDGETERLYDKTLQYLMHGFSSNQVT